MPADAYFGIQTLRAGVAQSRAAGRYSETEKNDGATELKSRRVQRRRTLTSAARHMEGLVISLRSEEVEVLLIHG